MQSQVFFDSQLKNCSTSHAILRCLRIQCKSQTWFKSSTLFREDLANHLSTITCCLCFIVSGSVFPIKIQILHRGSMPPVISKQINKNINVILLGYFEVRIQTQTSQCLQIHKYISGKRNRLRHKHFHWMIIATDPGHGSPFTREV